MIQINQKIARPTEMWISILNLNRAVPVRKSAAIRFLEGSRNEKFSQRITRQKRVLFNFPQFRPSFKSDSLNAGIWGFSQIDETAGPDKFDRCRDANRFQRSTKTERAPFQSTDLGSTFKLDLLDRVGIPKPILRQDSERGGNNNAFGTGVEFWGTLSTRVEHRLGDRSE
jgi:hypothetical protein